MAGDCRAAVCAEAKAGAAEGDKGSVMRQRKPMIEAVKKTAFTRSITIEETLFGLIHDPRDHEAVEALLHAALITAHGPNARSVDQLPEEFGTLITALIQAAQPRRDLAAEFAQQRADEERISWEQAHRPRPAPSPEPLDDFDELPF